MKINHFLLVAALLLSAKLSAFAIVNPGKVSAGTPYDQRMIHASEIATGRAHRHPTYRCWAYVKDALVASKIIDTRPTSEFAKEAALELSKTYGFKLLPENNPYNAPIGSVLVYGGHGAGHVEIRTSIGFVSDFASIKPSPRPLIGIYVKPV